jgi:hypothetical protein
LTVLLAGLGNEAPVQVVSGEEAAALATRLLAEGQTRKDTVRELVEQLGLPRNDAYRIVMELP